jgi:D-amino peptidase
VKTSTSIDMGGVGDGVASELLGPTGFEYQRFREFMTAQALAAIQNARESEATQFVVADAHSNMQKFLIERFPAGVTIIHLALRRLGHHEPVPVGEPARSSVLGLIEPVLEEWRA